MSEAQPTEPLAASALVEGFKRLKGASWEAFKAEGSFENLEGVLTNRVFGLLTPACGNSTRWLPCYLVVVDLY